MSFFEFPHTRTYDSDLGWLIWAMKKLIGDMTEFTEINSIKFGDPINWNIATQYEPTTIVVDDEGNGYISRKAVPAGIALTDTEYWTRIFNFSDITDAIRDSIAVNAGNSSTTPVALRKDDLVWWNGSIYKVLYDIAAGTAFIDGTNVTPYTVNERIRDFGSEIGTIENDITSLQKADTALQTAIEEEAAERIAADTAINKNLQTLSEDVADLESSIAADTLKTFMARPIYTKLRYKSEYPTTKALQGGCAISDTELFIICANKNYGDPEPIADCYVLSIPTMNVVRSARLNIAHGNSVTFRNGLCYVTTLGQSVFEVDPINMRVVREIVIDANKQTIAIAHNDREDVFYVTFRYEISTIYKYNSEFRLIDSFTLPDYNTLHGAGGQDMDIKDGILYYMLWEPNYTICYSLSKSRTERIFKNPEYLERHILKETEFITHTPSGTFYVGYNNGANNSTDPYTENVICEANFAKGIVESDNYIVGSNTYNTVARVYVDSSYDGNYSDGTQEYPYKEIQQALDNFNQRAYVALYVADGSYVECVIMDRFFYIEGNTENIIINGLSLYNCDATIRSVQITENADRDYALEALGGVVTMSSPTSVRCPSISINAGARLTNSGDRPESLRLVNGEYIGNTRVSPFLPAEITKVINTSILKALLRVPVAAGSTTLANNRYDDYRERYLWVDVTINGNTQTLYVPLIHGNTDIPVQYGSTSGKIRVNLNKNTCTITLTNCTIGSGTYIFLFD